MEAEVIDKKQVGRPSGYSAELGERICAGLTEGKPLGQVLDAPGMPSPPTVLNWLARHPEFLTNYTRAREIMAEMKVSEIFAIADDSSQDTVTRYREDGSEYTAVDHDHINRSRLRIDTRKWYASKVLPKLYGDHALPEGSTTDINLAVVVSIPRSSPAPLQPAVEIRAIEPPDDGG